MRFEAQGRVILFITVLSLGTVLATKEELRQKKHFSLFSVVTFKNEECSSDTDVAGGPIKGTCYTATECGDKSGTKSGNCASGFGVCCVFIYKTLSATTISENRTYIRNPNYPDVETSGAGTSTVYTLTRMQSDICQIRLDFDSFVIVGPTNTDESGTAGVAAAQTNCQDQWTTVLGSNVKIPILCGIMDGEHLYLDIGMDSADTAAITLALVATGTTSYVDAMRKWSVKTSQIPCWATYRAPDGCHRYFMQNSGQIISPNFKKVPAGTSRAAGQLLSGIDLLSQHLKTCIRREQGMCCTRFQVCNQYGGIDLGVSKPDASGDGSAGIGSRVSEGWSFHVGILKGVPAGAATATDMGVVDGGCSSDYVEIPDSTTGMRNYGAAVQVNTRYCGTRFGNVPNAQVVGAPSVHAAVYDCTEPWEVTYRTDQMNDNGVAAAVIANVDGADIYRGLCLDFTQEAC